MKILLNVLKVILVIILLVTVVWYLFGADGPLGDLQIVDWAKGAFAEEEVVEQESVEKPVIEEAEVQEAELKTVDTTATVVFTGDVELSDAVLARYDSEGVEGILEESLLSMLQDADVLMINNEFCFSTRGEKAADKQYTFRVDPKYVSVLKDMGVDVAGLANNHSIDYGRDALKDTFATFDDAMIDYTGAGMDVEDSAKLVVKTDEMGRKYGFLAASRVIPFGSWNVESVQPGVFTCYDDSKLIECVKAARPQVDYLYVMVHWGVEHTIELEAHQTQIGHDLVDAGADAVVGMHSHCLQPVEMYEGKPIFYSLGNFIFNENVKSGGAVALKYNEDGLESIQIVPTVASGACTKPAKSSNPSIFDEINNMSPLATIDKDGYLYLK